MTDWCFGKSSAPDVKRHLLAVVADHGDSALPVVKELSKIGGHSATTQNCNRQLGNFLGKLNASKLIEAVPRSLVSHLVPPHLLFQALIHHGDVAQKSLGAKPDEVLQFWEGLYASDEGKLFASEHKQLIGKTPQDLCHTLPLTIHEDAGPYAKNRSVVEVSWASILGRGRDIECKFVAFTHLKENKSVTATREPNRAWRRFIDSLVLLETGIYPEGSARHNEPIAQDANGVIWKAIVLFGKSDGEQQIAWGLPGHTSSDEMCGFCLANRTTRPYTCLKPEATWQVTEIGTTTSFCQRLIRPLHHITLAFLFSFWFVRMDIMHLHDCKGAWSILEGGVLWLLVNRETRLGNSQEARMQAINVRKNQWYRDHAVHNRMPDIKVTNLMAANGYAELSGPAIKAANTRGLLHFVKALADEFFDHGTVYDKAITKLLTAGTGILGVFYAAGTFLTDVEHATLGTHVRRFGRYFQLCQSLADDDPLWHLTPKVHQTMHLPKQAKLINPRAVHNYTEESLVGKVAKIWHACANGGYLTRVQNTVLLKYLNGVFLTLGIPLENNVPQ